MTDSEGEFVVMDRTQKIRQIINEYGEQNFALSFSGGKDSTVLSHLLDEALPGNRIPRFFANTGIEYQLILQFVRRCAERDNRIKILNAGVNIPQMLKQDGYPIKSKQYSEILGRYQRGGMKPYIRAFVDGVPPYDKSFKCPPALKYQFKPEFPLKISDACCDRLKKDVIQNAQKQYGIGFKIVGLVQTEGGAAHEGRMRSSNLKKTAGRFI